MRQVRFCFYAKKQANMKKMQTVVSIMLLLNIVNSSGANVAETEYPVNIQQHRQAYVQ